jgi:hypothetical protein
LLTVNLTGLMAGEERRLGECRGAHEKYERSIAWSLQSLTNGVSGVATIERTVLLELKRRDDPGNP